MGRKIPAKKHRGVKNPLEQQARREKSLKSKINAPPRDPDEQPVPRSLTRLFEFQNKFKNSKCIDKKKQPLNKNDQKVSKGKNPVSELKRLAGESGRSFSLRINSAVRALHDSTLGLGYPQDMEAEDVKGERMAEQRARRRRKRRARPDASPAPPAPPRLQRRALEADQERVEVRYERVEFGEVAHAPPALLLKGAALGAPRPGRRALLLTPLLAGEQSDARRDAAVAAYRALNAARRRYGRGHGHGRHEEGNQRNKHTA